MDVGQKEHTVKDACLETEVCVQDEVIPVVNRKRIRDIQMLLLLV